MHNQSNNSKANRYPLIVNQDFIHHLTGIAHHAQEPSIDASIQFGAQNTARSNLNQRNSSYPRDNPISSSNNTLSRDNNNTYSNDTHHKTTIIPSLNNSNFPNLNMNNSRQQGDNFGIHRSTAFQAGRSYVNILRKISEKSTFTVCKKDFPELPQLSNNSVETTNMNNHQVVLKSPDDITTKNAKKRIGQNDETKPDITNPGSVNVIDPENPGSVNFTDQENPGSVNITDQENPGSVKVTDQENPGSVNVTDQENPGSVNVTDQENPGSVNVTDQESSANNQKSYVTFLKAGTTSEAQSYNNVQVIKPKIEVNTFLPDEKIINIPASVIHDQFGILGQLIAMKLANTDPDLVYLNFGEDLTSLGLSLNSPENILPKFAGPFSSSDLQPHNASPEPDFEIFDEYTINLNICDSLPKFNLTLYKEDLLFYLFYTQVQSDIQIKVGRELFSRHWRYHTEYRVWIIHGLGMEIIKKNDLFEYGTYYVFDVNLWKKVIRQLFIEYSKLEYIDKVNEDDYVEVSSNTIIDREWIQKLGFGNN